MRNRFGFLLFSIIILAAVCAASAFADTIITKDGKEIKGIVVEDYKDRIIFSTIDGEITVMKADIQELYFDSEEDNLIKLGDQAKERRDFTKAFAYYEMALKLNPNSKAAKDGLVFSQGFLFRKEEAKKEDDIQRREDFERYGSMVQTEQSESDKLKESIDKLKSGMGIAFKVNDRAPLIDLVRLNSPAYDAGVKKGDMLVAVWGRLTGYMSMKEFLGILLEKPSLEIKCTIERTVDVAIDHRKGAKPIDLIGASLSMEFDGLTISGVKDGGNADKAGLKKDDLITAIDGKSTRYMPMKRAIDTIKFSRSNTVKLTFRREIIIWRRDAK